jgi:hypothetical protein
MRFYRQTAAENIRVLLTGAGGDNWLSVADTHVADLLRSLRLVQLAEFFKAAMGTGGMPVRTSLRRLLWANGVRPHLHSLWALLAPASKHRYHYRQADTHLPEWLCPDKHLRAELLSCLLGRQTPPLSRSGALPRSQYRHSLRAAPNPYMHYENETAHHIESACGLRLLSPYHDRQLVSFLNRISPRLLIHEGRYKGLLRPVVAKRLPALGLERQRKLYPRDEREYFKNALSRSVASNWSGRQFNCMDRLGIVDKALLKRATARNFSTLSSDALAKMFILLGAEEWVLVHAAV